MVAAGSSESAGTTMMTSCSRGCTERSLDGIDAVGAEGAVGGAGVGDDVGNGRMAVVAEGKAEVLLHL